MSDDSILERSRLLIEYAKKLGYKPTDLKIHFTYAAYFQLEQEYEKVFKMRLSQVIDGFTYEWPLNDVYGVMVIRHDNDAPVMQGNEVMLTRYDGAVAE